MTEQETLLVMQMVPIKEYEPVFYENIYILTTYGKIREAFYRKLTLRFEYLDIENFYQNQSCKITDIERWCYVDERIRFDRDYFKPNHHYRQIEGEKILNSIPITFWFKLRILLLELLNGK